MHVVNNLDYDKSIVDQLQNYACSVNLAFPKEDDFNYKYAELNPCQKEAIWGMAIMLDSMQNAESEIDADCDETIIGRMKAEIKGDYLNELFNNMVCEMDMALISFGDTNMEDADE